MTGAITVTSATVGAPATGSIGVIAVSSAGGAVTITADSSSGGTHGIFTAFSDGATSITSNFAPSMR